MLKKKCCKKYRKVACINFDRVELLIHMLLTGSYFPHVQLELITVTLEMQPFEMRESRINWTQSQRGSYTDHQDSVLSNDINKSEPNMANKGLPDIPDHNLSPIERLELHIGNMCAMPEVHA